MDKEKAEVEIPLYECHKFVRALKIKSVERDIDLASKENRETDGSGIIIPENEDFLPFKVSYDYMKKRAPQAGGYYVVYKDGYESFSPAEAFEDGYTSADDITMKLSASEAIYAFVGWLTTEKEETKMGSHNDCAPVMERIKEFCERYELADPREGWEKNIVRPKE